MDDLNELHRLAPAVDTDTARAAFWRRRRRSRSLRRGGLAAAAVVVLAAGSVAVVANMGDDERPLVTGPAQDGAGASVAFEVLSVAEATDDMGTLRAATDQRGYDPLWDHSGSSGAPPVVDFAETVVVSITIPDDACPPELTAFERSGQTITPVFVEPEGGCDEPLIPKTYVVALRWSALGSGFTLRLPADSIYGFGEQRLEVDLGGPAPTSTVTSTPPVEDPVPTCNDITRFAGQIAELQSISDYQASASPEALFADSDLVLYGELTGGFVQGDPDFPGSYVGYEVEVRAVYKSPESVPLTDPLFINVAYNSAYDATRYEDAVVAGAPVVVFAHALSIRPGYSASIEGFATACPGDPPIGLVGSTDEWTSLTSLDDLVARLEVAANH